MVNKRGAISMEMIIIIILALITLVVVAAAFTGGMNQLISKISGIGSAIPGGDTFALSTCKTLCDSNQSTYCTQQLSGDLEGKTCVNVYACPDVNKQAMKPAC